MEHDILRQINFEHVVVIGEVCGGHFAGFGCVRVLFKLYKFIFCSILFFINLFLCVLNELAPFPCIVRRFTVIARGTCKKMFEA